MSEPSHAAKLLRGKPRRRRSSPEPVPGAEAAAVSGAAADAEERFRAIAELAPGIYWETDARLRYSFLPKPGAFMNANERRPALGRTPWEAAGANTAEDEAWGGFRAALEAHREVTTCRLGVADSSGRTGIWRVTAEPLRDARRRFRGYRGFSTFEAIENDGRERIERAEARLMAAIESISDGFALFDSDDRLVLSNSRYREIYEKTADAMVPGATFEDILRFGVQHGQFPDAIGREEEWLAERLSRHRNPVGTTEQRVSGGRWLRISEYRTADGHRVGVRTDITELKSREQQLCEKTTLLEATLNNMDQGITMVDRDLRLVAFNRRFLELFELPVEEVRSGMSREELARLFSERGEPNLGDVPQAAGGQAAHAHGLAPSVFTVTRPNDRVIEAHRSAIPSGGFVTTYRDVTSQEQRERELAEQSRLTRAILENMDQGVVTVDEDLRVLTANRRAAELLDVPPEMLVPGRSFSDFIAFAAERGDYGAGDPDELTKQHVAHASRHAVVRVEQPLPDGRTCEMRQTPMPGGGSVITYTDVTERRQRDLALAHQSRLMQGILESMDQGVIAFDGDLKVQAVNARAISLLQVPPSMLTIGADFGEYIRFVARRGDYGPGDPEQLAQGRIADAHRDAMVKFDRSMPDGTICETRQSPMPDGGGVVTYTDITESKRAAEALVESEQRFRDFAEAASDWFWETDEQFRFSYLSDRVRQLSDMPPEYFYGKTREEVGGGDGEGEKWAAHQAALDARKPFRDFAYRVTQPDGTTNHIRTGGVPVFDDRGAFKGYRGVGTEITAEVKAREALEESEARLKAVIDNAPVMIALKDLDGRCVLVNQYYCYMFGVAEDAAIGLTVFDLFDDRHAQTYRMHERETIEQGRTTQREILCPTVDGDRILLDTKFPIRDEMGDVVGLGFIGADITERKRAERALRSREKSFRTMLHKMAECVIATDERGAIEIFNAAAERIFGYAADEIVGQNISILFPAHEEEDESSGSIEALFAAGKRDARSMGREVTGLRRDGRLVPVQLSVAEVKLDERRMFIATMTDLSGKKAMEARLWQAQKLEAVGTLAGGIAHDFNNILGAIIGYTEMTLDDLAPDSTAHANLQKVMQAGRRAKDFVTQILAFSRADTDTQDVHPVLIDRVIKEAFGLLRGMVPSTIELRKSIAAPDALVLANESKLLQVVMNLCTNAIQAVGERVGVITIGSTEVRVDVDSAAVHHIEPGRYYTISVSDTGCGIGAATKARMFEPFFTTKEVGQGTGMGLAVVHGIVAEFGGCISVYSDPGEGAEFVIYLPRCEEATGQSKDADGGAIAGGDERVLVIDDEAAIVDVASQLLRRLGYDVVGQTSGLDAMQILREAPERFDLVITDQTMPNITGDQIIAEVRRIREDLPVILCTGYSKAVTEGYARELGAYCMVTKPYTAEILGRAVRRAIDDGSGTDTEARGR